MIVRYIFCVGGRNICILFLVSISIFSILKDQNVRANMFNIVKSAGRAGVEDFYG